MKLHKPLVVALVQTLMKIFVEGWHADKAVEQVLKQNSKWGARDRKFIAENVYEIVRWKRFLTIVLADEEGLTPLFFYRLFATKLILNKVELPDWEEFSDLNKKQIFKNAKEAKLIRKYRESIPNWLDDLGCKELGDKVWEKEIAALNKEANVVLRVNTLKTSLANLKNLLLEKGIETTEIKTTPNLFSLEYIDALVLTKRLRLHHLDEFKKGFFEIQDASSQLIAPYMELQGGMTIVDACAGAGGKSLHIAALLKNNGQIVSMDVEERKLIELNKRANRAGANIINTKLISSKNIDSLKNSADRLLLDVPCSGLGVLRRNPDAKWKLNTDFIEQIINKQQEILQNYSSMLKANGLLIYATCSILPSENQNQVNLFLKNNPNFEFVDDKKIMPSEGYDGFYMAKLKRLS